MKNQITIPKKRYDEMIFADAINYAHDLVIECGELYLPHKIEAHNAIDMIEATYKSELQAHVKNFESRVKNFASTINILVAENARLEAANAKMREVLDKASDTMRLVIESAWDVMQPHLVQEICHCGLAIEKSIAAEGGAK